MPHRPMLLGTAAGVQLDLGILERSDAVHIAIAAERLSLDDLRLAYRRAAVSCFSNTLAAWISRGLWSCARVLKHEELACCFAIFRLLPLLIDIDLTLDCTGCSKRRLTLRLGVQ